MNFLISGQHINPIYLAVTGFLIGVFGGFFGVGGSFLAGPALYAVGVPMNFVVGTDLAHIVGKSIVAAKKHSALGNVDIKLGMAMVLGTIMGVETGAQGIEYFKRQANVNLVVGSGLTIVLVSISTFIFWEVWRTSEMQNRRRIKRKRKDESAFDHFPKRVWRIKLPPMIELPVSDIKKLSLWVILFVSFIGGIFSGFLGGGAGYIRMPMLVYILGVPTHVAVGTDLFEVVISASYGTVSHALKGNVDIMIALVMHTGAAIGAQIGALLTERFSGPRIRLAFAPLPLLGAALLVYNLFTRGELK
ncbi:MAG TPA: sulfite exporter TauE/SafE family protein [Acidobacteriota bacterium]|jgi:hypothetical protein|nr:sulfite exporter TauE/SafE family protein [Acidobacteriota bacterium]